MPEFIELIQREQATSQHRQYQDHRNAELQLIAWTLMNSYFMARASDPQATTQQRTLFFMANSLSSLYLLDSGLVGMRQNY